MKDKFSNMLVTLLLGGGILLFIVLFFVSSHPFTVYNSLSVEIRNSSNTIGSFNELSIERVSENNKDYLIIQYSGDSVNGDITENKSGTIHKVKIKCTKSQLETINKLPSGYYYLYYSNSKFDKYNGKLIGVYPNNPS